MAAHLGVHRDTVRTKVKEDALRPAAKLELVADRRVASTMVSLPLPPAEQLASLGVWENRRGGRVLVERPTEDLLCFFAQNHVAGPRARDSSAPRP
jgi:hypothetical protein